VRSEGFYVNTYLVKSKIMQILHLKLRYQNKLLLCSPLSMSDQVSQPTEQQGTLHGAVHLNLQVLREQTRKKKDSEINRSKHSRIKSILHDYNFNLLCS